MDWVRLVSVLFVLESFLFATGDAFYANYQVHINTKQCIYETDQKFLSIAVDSGLIRKRWENFNFTSEKLHNLAKGLAPAYLRIGGTDEDFLLFNPNESHDEQMDSHILLRGQHMNSYTNSREQRIDPYSNLRSQPMKTYTNFTMNTNDVENVFTFAKKAGLSIIFGLNVLLRDSKTHLWNSTNAQQLMKYLTSSGFSCDWELGNEPFDLHGLVNRTITGKELASDFKILRKLLNDHPEYGQMLLGPDVSSPWKPPLRNKFLEEFLTNIDSTIDGMTYHQYYTNNQANVSEFYNPDILDDLIKAIQQVEKIMIESGASTIDLWLGETSSAYGGGVPGVSDSYIAGFMWLDKLGVAARLRHKVVVRQTFYGGSYSLINVKTLDPNPDYWSTLLYKRLVGSRVLQVQDGISLGRKIRVYAHCTSERSAYETGSLVLIALNTRHDEVQLALTDGLEKLPVHQYLFTPGEKNNLTSQSVRLNGELLQMLHDKFLPPLQPKTITPPENITLPPVSFAFFVIPNAEVAACKRSCEELSEEKSVNV